MTFVDTAALPVEEKRPGWRGRRFHSPSMTFVHWEFDAGADIHRHHHPNEEVWQVLEGRLEVTVGEETAIAGPGMAAVIPADTPHAVRVLEAGKAIVTDWPLREG